MKFVLVNKYDEIVDACEIAKSFGEEYPIEYISERQGEIKHSICDPTFSKEELGWKTKIDVIDYIRNTYIYG